MQTGSTVKDMKKHLAVMFGKDVGDIDIVCLEGGRIHTDPTPLNEIPRPLQVMIGNPDRKAFTTTTIKNSADKLLITMSCGHSISKIKHQFSVNTNIFCYGLGTHLRYL